MWAVCLLTLPERRKSVVFFLPLFCVSLEGHEVRFGFADMKQKKPREDGDRKEAAHTGVSSGWRTGGRGWEQESKKEVSPSRSQNKAPKVCMFCEPKDESFMLL